MTRISPFSPFGSTSVTAGAASVSAKLPALDVRDLSGNNPVQLLRAGQSVKIDIIGTVTGPVFIKFGDYSVVAAATDIPVVQSQQGTILDIPQSATHIAVIASGADTPVVRMTVGASS